MSHSHLRRCLQFLLTPALVAALAACVQPSRSRQPGSPDEKIAFYQARIGGPASYPNEARLGLAYFEKYRATGGEENYQQAVSCLRQSLAHQQNFEALLGLARVLSERHQFKEAFPFAQEAAASQPADVQVQGLLFDLHLAVGDLDQAKSINDQMLRRQRGFESLSRLAALEEVTGNYAGALHAMQEARDAARPGTEDQTWADVRLGSLQVALGNADSARTAYARALASQPGGCFALEHLGELDAAQGRWKEAEQVFRKLQRNRPDPRYRVALAEAYRKRGDPAGSRRERALALDQLRRAAEEGAQDPFRPLALLCLEQTDTTAEGWTWAERDWAVRRDAMTADILAWACYCNGEYEKALALSEAALRTGNASPGVLLHGALIHRRAGRVEAGHVLLQRALANPLAFGPHERGLVESLEAKPVDEIRDVEVR